MKYFAVFSIVSLFCVLISFGLTQAQNSLTHNTGILEVTIIDNGYIGDDASGTYGGVVFNGNVNAMFTSGFIAGNQIYGASGMVGSFQSAGIPVIQDLVNTVPISGFSSNPYFDQISNYSLEVIFNPDNGGNVSALSNTGEDFVFIRNEVVYNDTVPLTDFYFGIFADWDIGGANYLLNRGGYDPGRNMLYQYENGGAGDANFYGILLINEASNTVRGTVDKDIVFTTTQQLRLDIFDLMTSTTFDTITVDGDYRMYLSSGPYTLSPGATRIFDYAIVAGTNLPDLQDNADSAILYGQNIPVELTSFTATSHSGKVYLNWATATETNNLGFAIERKVNNEGQWIKRTFKEGFGTTAEPKEYSYIDDVSDLGAASIYYRLKQVDFDGTFEYSDEVFVELTVPVEFALEQNYPNPFNPVTTINYSLPVKSRVELVIYNTLGESVSQLVNSEKDAGHHNVEIIATSLPSGVYFYRLQAGSFISTKKFILMK